MASLHKNAKTVISLDIKDFFPSIDRELVKKILTFYMDVDDEFANDIADTVCVDNHTPQGFPTSPTISNIAFEPYDYKIMTYCNFRKLRYTRYADDIVISSEKCISLKRCREIVVEVTHLIERNVFCSRSFLRNTKRSPFRVNREKTKIYRVGQRKIICGIVINGKSISVPKNYRKKVRAELHNVKCAIEGGKYIPASVIDSLRGKVAWIYRVNKAQGQQYVNQFREIEKLLF